MEGTNRHSLGIRLELSQRTDASHFVIVSPHGGRLFGEEAVMREIDAVGQVRRRGHDNSADDRGTAVILFCSRQRKTGDAANERQFD